jgi:hypothetical protein
VIRVVVQYSPTLFSIGIVDESAVTPTFEHNGITYYKAETHERWVLYKPSGLGWWRRLACANLFHI